ncbi:MAG: ATP-binding protein [Pseudomonadota bacterium]|nr:ATP-binding protein [Pseudomonadota bacterium]
MRQQQEEMNTRLRAALDAAESANRAKTRFLASASHDLRQPMHTLSLFAEALWLHPLDPATRDIAAHLRTASLALGTQLDALLDISKLDAAVVPVNAVDIELGTMLRRLHQQYIPEAERRNLAWQVNASGEYLCRTDPLLFERILRNLVDNAFKYTPSGGVLIAVESCDGEHVVSIADTGSGIASEEQERVFEEFYQVDNPERDRARGLGLGLSIVQRLVNLLGARLRLESSLGRGTTIEVALPAVAASLPAVGAAAPSPEVTGLHVLVIDDEEQVRMGMQTLLQGLGCSTDLVGSTSEALKAASHRKPSIVIADLRLRGADNGIEAIHGLRSMMPGLPALLLSGDTAPDRLRDAHSAGIRMLHKPVTLDVLLNAIEHELTV